ncbi:MAG TPA: hypothetical protein VK167_05445 [Flavipsychrobacter sp.]|jgi:hypothetical protein|nr:hypothetical protein [Chitinophagales bacterium]HLO70290.1 hypothetical protein [Flavipsychrobacter sp.]
MLTEKFSITERAQLRATLEAYGAIKDCAEKTGIHRCTISRVLKTGEATTPVISKLRIYLQAINMHVYVEAA